MEGEISQYITSCYDHERKLQLDEIYVTENKPVDEKYNTNTEEEDMDFYEYQKSIDEYNKDDDDTKILIPVKGKYEQGSLLQKVHEPLAGAVKDENGTLNYTVEDKELTLLIPSDEHIKAELASLKENGQVWEVEEDDKDMFKLQLLKELESSQSKFNVDDF